MPKEETVPERIARWQMRFSQSYCDYIHVPRKELVVADGLSRLPHATRYSKKTDDEKLIAFPVDIYNAQISALAHVGKLNELMDGPLLHRCH